MTAAPLRSDARAQLLAWARFVIEHHLARGGVPPVPVSELDPGLMQTCGAFVTLHSGPRLRGCIGTFEATAPLAEAVRDMAVAAATRDPRFPSVTVTELPDLRLEISVLSPRWTVTDPLTELRVGEHGIYITKGWHRGVLLPQVATDNGWDLDTFLQHTCLKAGLGTDAWRAPDAQVQGFSAQVFGEPEAGVASSGTE